MEKPKEFVVFYNGTNKNHFETNNEQLAHKRAVNGGTVYLDTRYKAKLRLYNYLNRIK